MTVRLEGSAVIAMGWGHARGASRAGQGGFALLEAVAALLVLVVGIAAVMSAVMALLVSAGVHRDVVQSGVKAVDLAETIDRVQYSPCIDVTTLRANLGYPKVVNGFSLDVASIDYLKDRTQGTADWLTAKSACDAGGDQGIQRITVSVERPGGRGTESLRFFKRDDRCTNVTTTMAGQTC